MKSTSTPNPSATNETVFHPKLDENGARLRIRKPSIPGDLAAWADPARIATTVPEGPLPASLNDVPFGPWTDAPGSGPGWQALVPATLNEPPYQCPPGKTRVSGVIIAEPDGRIWIVHPSNQYAGYEATFPKGKLEPTLSLAANAIKEAWEESGLKVELLRFLFDVDRGSGYARYYLARRTGGSPADMGWESQAVSLCPTAQLLKILNNARDHETARRLAAELEG